MATKIPVWAKGYLTIKSAWILGTAILIAILVAMLFGGWSIRETKQELKGLKIEQKDLKKLSEDLHKKVIADSLKIDSLENAIKIKSIQREKEIIIYRDNTKKNVDKINSPGFSNDDIRKGFSSN